MTASMMSESVDVLDRVALASALARLNEEEREILTLWVWHDQTFDEIGKWIGEKYRGRPLTGSAVRYHKNRALGKLRTWMCDSD